MGINELYIFGAAGVVVFVLFVWNIVLSVKLSGLKKRFNQSITNYSENFNLEEMLCKTVSEVNLFRQELDKNKQKFEDENNLTNKKLEEEINKVRTALTDESKVVREMIDVINNNLKICVQKTAVIRYNPFENVGGELCFALACLDKKNDGFILNTIFTENGSYTYCKPVVDGVSSVKLSSEEQNSLDLAKNKY